MINYFSARRDFQDLKDELHWRLAILWDWLQGLNMAVEIMFWIAASWVCIYSFHNQSNPSPVEMLQEMYRGGEGWMG